MDRKIKQRQFKFELLPAHLSTEFKHKFLQYYNQAINKEWNVENLENFLAMIMSENTFKIYFGLVGLNKYLTMYVSVYGTIGIFIVNTFSEQNVIQYIFHLIVNSTNQLILDEAIEIVSRLVVYSSSVAKVIIENGLIVCFKKLLQKKIHEDICINICKALTGLTKPNIDKKIHQLVVTSGILEIIIQMAEKQTYDQQQNLNMMHTITYAISNYAFECYFETFKYFIPSLQLLSRWILNENLNLETVGKISLAIVRCTHNITSQQLSWIAQNLGILPRLIYLVAFGNCGVFHKCLTLINKILEQLPSQQDYIFSLDLIPCLIEKLNLIKSENIFEEKLLNYSILETFELISSNPQWVNSLLKNNLIQKLVHFSNFEKPSVKLIMEIFLNMIAALETSQFQQEQLREISIVLKAVMDHVNLISDQQLDKLLEILNTFCKNNIK